MRDAGRSLARARESDNLDAIRRVWGQQRAVQPCLLRRVGQMVIDSSMPRQGCSAYSVTSRSGVAYNADWISQIPSYTGFERAVATNESGRRHIVKDPFFKRDESYDLLATHVLYDFLMSQNAIERARALAARCRRVPHEPSVVETILSAITATQNRHGYIMGRIAVSHIGFACLWWFGAGTGQAQLLQLLDAWPEPDRSDLLWFLRSEDIGITSTVNNVT